MQLPVVTSILDLYIAEINRYPILKADEEFKLAVRFKTYKDLVAAERLVVHNLRFVVKVAHKYRNYRVKLADLIQEGNLGLMRAVKKFDPHKGYRLISYAVWWIRAYMQNYIIKMWSLVKIGTTQTQRKLFFKLCQAKKRLENLTQKNPEFREIAELLGVKVVEIEEIDLRLSHRDVSLDATIGDDSETTHRDFLTYDGEDQETALIKKQGMELVQRQIAGALESLSEKESYIIQHRVMSDKPETLQEIGNRYNFTRERARQIEAQALKKMKAAITYTSRQPVALLEA